MSVRTSVIALLVGCTIAAATGAGSPAWFLVRGGDWEPDPTITVQLQSGLQPAVATLAGNTFKRFRPWQEYKFQYQGQQSNSSRYVFISATCHSDESWDLTERFVLVLDGGPCYFEIKYDPTLQRFYDLLVHGDA
jgi:hypothetical protein